MPEAGSALPAAIDAHGAGAAAYAQAIAGPEAQAAVQEAFEALEARLRGRATVPDPAELRQLTHAAVREASARHAVRPDGPPPPDSACEDVPQILASRASGELQVTYQALLDRHLSECAQCRALERVYAGAEARLHDSGPPPAWLAAPGGAAPAEDVWVPEAVAAAGTPVPEPEPLATPAAWIPDSSTPASTPQPNGAWAGARRRRRLLVTAAAGALTAGAVVAAASGAIDLSREPAAPITPRVQAVVTPNGAKSELAELADRERAAERRAAQRRAQLRRDRAARRRREAAARRRRAAAARRRAASRPAAATPASPAPPARRSPASRPAPVATARPQPQSTPRPNRTPRPVATPRPQAPVNDPSGRQPEPEG